MQPLVEQTGKTVSGSMLPPTDSFQTLQQVSPTIESEIKLSLKKTNNSK